MYNLRREVDKKQIRVFSLCIAAYKNEQLIITFCKSYGEAAVIAYSYQLAAYA